MVGSVTHAFRAISISLFNPKRPAGRMDNEALKFRSSIAGMLGKRRDQCVGRLFIEIAGEWQLSVLEGDDALGKLARCHVIVYRGSKYPGSEGFIQKRRRE